jgi:hypothetical protein
MANHILHEVPEEMDDATKNRPLHTVKGDSLLYCLQNRLSSS